MKKAKWIWLNTAEKADEYAVFKDEFVYEDGAVCADISVAGDYALYINDKLVSFGQYADYEKRKVYDTINITPFVKVGKNQIKIVAWYVGADFFTVINIGRGLFYEIYTDSTVLAYSHAGVQSALSAEYVSYNQRVITGQLGFSYTYDTRKSDEKFASAVEVKGFENLVPRPNEKLVLGEFVKGQVCDEAKRIYDLGKECSGVLKIRFRAKAGEEVTVAYGEHLADGKVREIIGSRDFTVRFIGNGDVAEATGLFRRLGCRYLQIYASEQTEILEIGIQETVYPFTVKPYEISNPLRKKIYETSVRTLELCAHEHYEDCPWREQGMYIEDSRNQMLCGYYAFENPEFMRSAILSILQGQREDGLFELCFPSNCEFTIPSFSLVFPAMVLEYTQATKETEIAELALPSIEKMLAFFLEELQENGLYKTVSSPKLWHFYEWAGDLDGNFFAENEADRYRNQFDVLANAFLSWACKQTAEICAVLGEFDKAKSYLDRTHGLNESLHKLFFNEEKLLYRTYEGREEYSQLANAMCVLCGACPEEVAPSLAEKIARGYDGWVENTLSMNIFRFDALLQVDKEKYADFVLKEIDAIYGNMLAQGATSFWETAIGEADFDGAGSLCHGWSAIPIYYYHILGVEKEKKKPLSSAFALKNNEMRTAYKDSVQAFIEKRSLACKSARDEFLYRSAEEKRAALIELLGEPLTSGEKETEISLIKRELVLKTKEWIVERCVFSVLGGVEFSGFLYNLVDDTTEKKALVYAIHGGGGTPERVGGLFHGTANYNDMVRRVLKKGVAVFAPQLWLWYQDLYGSVGDRNYWNRRMIQQGGTVSALELFCLMRTVDYFSAQKYVDEKKIGAVGLSYGGMYALYFGALDERIKAVVSDCWFNDRLTHNWSDWAYWGAEKKVMDAEVASIVLPRKLYIEIGKNDVVFKVESAQAEKERLLKFAKETGQEACLQFVEFDGGHEFNRDNAVVTDFLKTVLE